MNQTFWTTHFGAPPLLNQNCQTLALSDRPLTPGLSPCGIAYGSNAGSQKYNGLGEELQHRSRKQAATTQINMSDYQQPKSVGIV